MANIKITTADDLRLFKGWVLAGRAHLNHRAWLFLFGSLQLLICRGIFLFWPGTERGWLHSPRKESGSTALWIAAAGARLRQVAVRCSPWNRTVEKGWKAIGARLVMNTEMR